MEAGSLMRVHIADYGPCTDAGSSSDCELEKASAGQPFIMKKSRLGLFFLGRAVVVLGCIAFLLAWLGSGAGRNHGLRAAADSVVEAVGETRTTPMTAAAVASSVNIFGFSLLSALYKTADNSSVFISPLSIVSALGMVTLGTTPDKTAESELLGAWGVNASQAPDFFDGLRHQTSELMALKDVDLLSVNSVWCKSTINDAFIKAAQHSFDAEAKQLPRNPTPINDWCKKATNGMIPSILDKIDEKTVAVLVNAVYFKGIWASKFNKDQSVRGIFRSPKTGETPCAMMKRTDEKMRYSEVHGAQIVELPYGTANGRIAATIILPSKTNGALAHLVSQLDTPAGTALLTEKLGGLRPTHVRLQLPRFKVEFGVHDLKPELKSAFSIVEAFNGTGEFLQMSDDKEVHLSSVFHKVVVEVDEEGSKAAAVTAGVMMTRAAIVMPSPPKDVIVDRPFLFLIRDTSTGMLLFAGIVSDPTLDTRDV